MRLPLPYPPSINHYWRSLGRGRVVISKAGREYRDAIKRHIEQDRYLEPFDASERISLILSAHVPDRRRRDLDNLQKPLLDALGHAGVYPDDSQIDWLFTERCDRVPGGLVFATLDNRPLKCVYA